MAKKKVRKLARKPKKKLARKPVKKAAKKRSPAKKAIAKKKVKRAVRRVSKPATPAPMVAVAPPIGAEMPQPMPAAVQMDLPTAPATMEQAESEL